MPIIAAVNGPAIGAGCGIASMCDIRIASRKAKFAESFVKLGIIPGDGGAWLLQRVVGYQRAAELSFSGRIFDADEAPVRSWARSSAATVQGSRGASLAGLPA